MHLEQLTAQQLSVLRTLGREELTDSPTDFVSLQARSAGGYVSLGVLAARLRELQALGFVAETEYGNPSRYHVAPAVRADVYRYVARDVLGREPTEEEVTAWLVARDLR